MFDAARGLLASSAPVHTEVARTHSGLISAFGLHMVKSGLLNAELGRSLNRAQQVRMIADYTGDSIDVETAGREALAFISTEIHKSFKPFFAGGSDEDKAKAGEVIRKRTDYLAQTMKGDFLFGNTVSVADCYLFVMLTWAKKNAVAVSEKFGPCVDRMMALPSVRTAMTHEGLI